MRENRDEKEAGGRKEAPRVTRARPRHENAEQVSPCDEFTLLLTACALGRPERQTALSGREQQASHLTTVATRGRHGNELTRAATTHLSRLRRSPLTTRRSPRRFRSSRTTASAWTSWPRAETRRCFRRRFPANSTKQTRFAVRCAPPPHLTASEASREKEPQNNTQSVARSE